MYSHGRQQLCQIIVCFGCIIVRVTDKEKEEVQIGMTKSEAEAVLNKESLNSQGIFESLGLSQNSNSQLLDLEIKRDSENEGQLIGKTLNEFAERSIKKSYPDKNISVQYHFFQSEINGSFNYKLFIAAVVIGLFMGVVVLIMIDAFSSRILSSEYVESYNVKVLGKIKDK